MDPSDEMQRAKKRRTGPSPSIQAIHEHAGQKSLAYAIFMWVKIQKDAPDISPGPVIDEQWHLHILDTRAYRQFFEHFDIPFVDHDPRGAGEEQDCARAKRYSDFLEFLAGQGMHAEISTVLEANQTKGAIRVCAGRILDGPYETHSFPLVAGIELSPEEQAFQYLQKTERGGEFRLLTITCEPSPDETTICFSGCVPWVDNTNDLTTPRFQIFVWMVDGTTKTLYFNGNKPITAAHLAYRIEEADCSRAKDLRMIHAGRQIRLCGTEDVRVKHKIADGSQIYLTLRLRGC